MNFVFESVPALGIPCVCVCEPAALGCSCEEEKLLHHGKGEGRTRKENRRSGWGTSVESRRVSRLGSRL